VAFEVEILSGILQTGLDRESASSDSKEAAENVSDILRKRIEDGKCTDI
jgi:hypothetical protein